MRSAHFPVNDKNVISRLIAPARTPFGTALGAFLAASCAATGVYAPSAYAQSSTSREVVQPLPSSETQRLNRALLELARSPSSVAAMLEAGDASLDVGDLDAAIGFYGSAADLDPSDARIQLGLARVYLRSGRPVEAIPLLDEAQAAGAPARDVLSERALAYDLLGDSTAAQNAYRSAIELAPQDDEARRRLGISQAISGDKAGFQATLSPLIKGRDIAAFRARAFGLAILGEQERAEGIVNSVMPPDIAARINPYLEYMPRLTPAQQAAAANLGIFPRAADIGREDPSIARFASAAAASGSKLEPAGEPLGASTPTPVETPEAAPEEGLVEAPTEVSTIKPAPNTTAGPVRPTDAMAAPERVTEALEKRGESLPSVATREIGQVETQEAVSAASVPSASPSPASVADAFADMGEADLPAEQRPADAVDIAAIEVPREAQQQAQQQAEQEKPAHPRRIWVQLATGRDVKALGFDWRRFNRRAPELLGEFDPHVTPWGEANRLLAGPLDNATAARALVNELAKKGIETFTFTSPQGTEIKKLK